MKTVVTTKCMWKYVKSAMSSAQWRWSAHCWTSSSLKMPSDCSHETTERAWPNAVATLPSDRPRVSSYSTSTIVNSASCRRKSRHPLGSHCETLQRERGVADAASMAVRIVAKPAVATGLGRAS